MGKCRENAGKAYDKMYIPYNKVGFTTDLNTLTTLNFPYTI
jgi:hypothetical protein